MVLKDDTINQTMLVPMDLRNLIPEDHPCSFIKILLIILIVLMLTASLLVGLVKLRILANCCLD